MKYSLLSENQPHINMIGLDCFAAPFHYCLFSLYLSLSIYLSIYLSLSFSLRATLRKSFGCRSFLSRFVLKWDILNTSLKIFRGKRQSKLFLRMYFYWLQIHSFSSACKLTSRWEVDNTERDQLPFLKPAFVTSLKMKLWCTLVSGGLATFPKNVLLKR